MILSVKRVITAVIIFQFFFGEVCYADFGVVTENQIQIFSSEKDYSTKNVKLNLINAFTYNPAEKDIYVSAINEESGGIYRIKTTGETAYNIIPIIARQSLQVQGIAFDHTSSTLYWTINDIIFFEHVPDKEITVKSTGRVFLRTMVGYPKSIAVRGKYLYWVNARTESQEKSIQRSPLERSDQQTVVENLKNPIAITVDVEKNTLYYIDKYTNISNAIYILDLNNGAKHRLFNLTNKSDPCVIALDDMNVYWIDWWTKELLMTSKNSVGRRVWPMRLFKINLNISPIGLFVVSDGNTKLARKKDFKNEVSESVNRAG